MKRRSTRCWGPWIAAALAALVFTASAAPAPRKLETVKVELRQVSAPLLADAIVEAVHQASIEAPVGGRITELPFDAGQLVRRGQVLVRIEDRQSDGAMIGAKAQYERARRVRQANPDALSPAALEQARAAYEAALGARSITAPFNGVLGRLDVSVGDAAAPGKPLLMLYNPNSLRLVADIPVNRLSAIQARPQARIELPGAQKNIEALRIEFLPATDARTQTARVRVYLPAGFSGLLPGSFARIQFVTGGTPTLVIAQDAVLRRGEITAAYIVQADGSLALRQIRLGHPVGDKEIEVLAGLKVGERVARHPVEAGVLRPTSTQK